MEFHLTIFLIQCGSSEFAISECFANFSIEFCCVTDSMVASFFTLCCVAEVVFGSSLLFHSFDFYELMFFVIVIV